MGKWMHDKIDSVKLMIVREVHKFAWTLVANEHCHKVYVPKN